MAYKVIVQESLMRETEIEVDEETFNNLNSDDREKRDNARDKVIEVYDKADKETDISKTEWVGTVFMDEEDNELFDVS